MRINAITVVFLPLEVAHSSLVVAGPPHTLGLSPPHLCCPVRKDMRATQAFVVNNKHSNCSLVYVYKQQRLSA